MCRSLLIVLTMLLIRISDAQVDTRQESPNRLTRKEKKARTRAAADFKKAAATLELFHQSFFTIASNEPIGVYAAEKAGERYARALSAIDRFGNSATVDELIRRAELLAVGRQFRDAAACLRRAQSLTEKDSLPKARLPLWNAFAMLYLTEQRPYQASIYNERALGQIGTDSLSDPELGALNHRALLLRERMDLRSAEEILRRSVSKAKQSGNRLATFSLINNLAIVLAEEGRLREAESVLSTGLTEGSQENGDADITYINAQVNLAMIAFANGRAGQAESILERALVSCARQFLREDVAKVTLLLAQVLTSERKFEDAHRLLIRMMDDSRKYGAPAESIKSRIALALAQLARFRSNPAGALEWLERVDATPPYRNAAEQCRALALFEMGRITEAKASFKTLFDRGWYFPINNSGHTLRKRRESRIEETIRMEGLARFVIKAVPDDSMLCAILAEAVSTTQRIDPIVRLEREAWDDLQLRLVYQNWRLDSEEQLSLPDEVKDSAFLTASKQLQNALSGWEESYGIRRRSQEFTGPEELTIQMLTVPDDEKNQLSLRSYLALISRNSRRHVIRIGSADSIERMTAAFREQFKNRAEDSKPYAVLWAPFDKYLEGIKTVRLVSAGAYSELNVAALQGKDGKYVGDRISIHQAIEMNHGFAEALPKTGKNMTAVLIGNPEYGKSGHIEPMRGAGPEMRLVGKLMAHQKMRLTTLSGPGASEQKIKSVQGGDVVHVNAYRFALRELQPVRVKNSLVKAIVFVNTDDLSRTGLLLSGAEDVFGEDYVASSEKNDGVFTAYEMQRLDLSKTDLVMLMGNDAGFNSDLWGQTNSMSRACFIAGARTVMTTLWDPGIDAESQFVAAFYAIYLKTGNKHAAFNQARDTVRKRFKDAAMWAAFVLIDRQ